MGFSRIFFRFAAFLLHVFIAFILVVKMMDHDVTNSWMRLGVFGGICLMLAYSLFWHVRHLLRYTKTNIS